MIAVTASPSVDRSAQTAFVTRLKSYLLYTLCACLYILPFMRLYMVGTDEGTLDYGAVRVVHGQVFARDFFRSHWTRNILLAGGVLQAIRYKLSCHSHMPVS